MPAVVATLPSSLGDPASGGGVMPASPQNSALDDVSSDGISRSFGSFWVPFNKDVIDQALNAALARMTTAPEPENERTASPDYNSTSGQQIVVTGSLIKIDNDSPTCHNSSEGKAGNDRLSRHVDNEHKKRRTKKKKGLCSEQMQVDKAGESDSDSRSSSGRNTDTPDSVISRASRSPALSDSALSRSTQSPVLSEGGWLTLPREAVDNLFTKELDKYEEQESRSSSESSVQASGLRTPEDSRDHSPRTNQNSSSHSPPEGRNASVIVSRPSEVSPAGCLPQRPETPPSQSESRPSTAKEAEAVETPSWVVVEKQTLESLVETAMTKAQESRSDESQQSTSGVSTEKANSQISASSSQTKSVSPKAPSDALHKQSTKVPPSEPLANQPPSHSSKEKTDKPSVSNKKCDSSAKKRQSPKHKRTAAASGIGRSDLQYAMPKRPCLPPGGLPSPASRLPLLPNTCNTLSGLLEPGADLNVHRNPSLISSYPQLHFSGPPPMPLVVPHPFPALHGLSAFRPPGANQQDAHPRPYTDVAPLDLSQPPKEPGQNQASAARKPDQQLQAHPATAVSQAMNERPLNNQSASGAPAELQLRDAGPQHKAAGHQAAPDAPRSSPRPEDMASPRASPWVVLDINQVDNIFDRMLQEEHSPSPAPTQSDQECPESAAMGAKAASPLPPTAKGDGQEGAGNMEGQAENEEGEDFNINVVDTDQVAIKEGTSHVQPECAGVSQNGSEEERERSISPDGNLSSPRHSPTGGAGPKKWKSDLLRKFNGGTEGESDASSPRDQSPSPIDMPREGNHSDNHNNNNELEEARASNRKKAHKKKIKRTKRGNQAR